MKIGLVACCKSKKGADDPLKKFRAQDIYTGNTFKKSKAYVLDPLNEFDDWHILSEKHKLLDKNKMIEYYNTYLGDLSCEERREWGETILAQLAAKYDLKNDEFYIFGGRFYYEHLIPHLNCVVFEFKNSNCIDLEAPRRYYNGGM